MNAVLASQLTWHHRRSDRRVQDPVLDQQHCSLRPLAGAAGYLVSKKYCSVETSVQRPQVEVADTDRPKKAPSEPVTRNAIDLDDTSLKVFEHSKLTHSVHEHNLTASAEDISATR